MANCCSVAMWMCIGQMVVETPNPEQCNAKTQRKINTHAMAYREWVCFPCARIRTYTNIQKAKFKYDSNAHMCMHAHTQPSKYTRFYNKAEAKAKSNRCSPCLSVYESENKKQKLKCSSQYVQFKWTTYSSWDSNLMITAVFVVVCFCWKLISSHIFIKWLNAFKLLLIFFRVRQIFFSSFQIHYLSSLHFDAMKCQCTGNATQSFMLHK